ncbi:ABC transporter, ATP-binding protein [Cutibacterium acnes 6609]|nr:ABC transporter, ATP-binding protein [Cutibacterium acnes 6609]
MNPVVAVAFVGVSLRYTKVLENVGAATLAVETAREPVAEVDEILSATTRLARSSTTSRSLFRPAD